MKGNQIFRSRYRSDKNCFAWLYYIFKERYRYLKSFKRSYKFYSQPPFWNSRFWKTRPNHWGKKDFTQLFFFLHVFAVICVPLGQMSSTGSVPHLYCTVFDNWFETTKVIKKQRKEGQKNGIIDFFIWPSSIYIRFPFSYVWIRIRAQYRPVSKTGMIRKVGSCCKKINQTRNIVTYTVPE